MATFIMFKMTRFTLFDNSFEKGHQEVDLKIFTGRTKTGYTYFSKIQPSILLLYL